MLTITIRDVVQMTCGDPKAMEPWRLWEIPGRSTMTARVSINGVLNSDTDWTGPRINNPRVPLREMTTGNKCIW